MQRFDFSQPLSQHVFKLFGMLWFLILVSLLILISQLFLNLISHFLNALLLLHVLLLYCALSQFFELPFSVLSLTTPLLLSSSLFFSLSPLTFLAVVSVAVSAAISESAVFSVSVAAAISAFVVLCLSAALFLLVVLLLLSADVSVVLLHFLLAVSLFVVVLLHFLLPVVLRSGAMFGAERSGVLVLIALWEPLPVRRAARSGAMFGAERSGAMFGAERSSFL